MARIVATGPPLIHIVDLQGARDGALRLERGRALRGRAPRHPPPGLGRDPFARCGARAPSTPGRRGSSSEPRCGKRTAHSSSSCRSLGTQLLVALDVRDGHIAIRGWTRIEWTRPRRSARALSRRGVARLHVTAIERDGTMRGPDLALYRTVCASGIAVVAAGGVRDDRDVEAFEGIGCEAAVMGLGYLTRLGLESRRLFSERRHYGSEMTTLPRGSSSATSPRSALIAS